MGKKGFLLIEKGPGSGQRYPIDGGRPVSIGRGKRCVIRIDHGWCSREHCLVELRDEETWLIDLGSKNGTSVNGMPVEERQMMPGDRVILGATTLLYLEEEDISRGRISLEDGEDDTETLDPLTHPLEVISLQPDLPPARWSKPEVDSPWGGAGRRCQPNR